MKKTLLAVLTLILSLNISAQPRIVGHRAARHNTTRYESAVYYENTLEALKFAQGLGIYAAEFDVQLTANEKVIVYHGPKVPGEVKTINEMSYKHARRVDLPGGHEMPSLKSWFKQAKKTPAMKIIMELKPQSDQERERILVEKCMKKVEKYEMEEQIEYTSFSEFICQEIHRIDPSAKVILLASGDKIPTPEYCASKGYNGLSLDVKAWKEHPEYAGRARKLGIETTLWLANTKEIYDWAARIGIDFTTSDHPETAIRY